MTLIALLMAVSTHSIHEQSVCYEQLDVASQAARNVEKANGSIFAVVMESGGIYMSNDRATVKRYGEALLRVFSHLAVSSQAGPRKMTTSSCRWTARPQVVVFLEFGHARSRTPAIRAHLTAQELLAIAIFRAASRQPKPGPQASACGGS